MPEAEKDLKPGRKDLNKRLCKYSPGHNICQVSLLAGFGSTHVIHYVVIDYKERKIRTMSISGCSFMQSLVKR